MWPVFASLVFAFVAISLGVASVVAAAATLLKLPDAEEGMAAASFALAHPPVLIASVAVSSSLLCAAALVPAWLSPTPLRQRLSLHTPRLSPLVWIAAVVGTPTVGQAAESLARLLGLKPPLALERIADALRNASGYEVPLLVLVLGVAPGVAEELMFRGYVQTRLMERWGPWIAITVSALLFGIFHGDPSYAVLAATIGAYLGFVAHRCGSIVPSMGAHAINNMVSAAVVLRGVDGEGAGPHGPMAAVSALVAVGCVVAVRRGTRDRIQEGE